jgi:CheY-like chemotaxis protein
MEGDSDSILAAGIDDYLTKPLKKAAILDVLRSSAPATVQAPVPHAPPDQPSVST